MQEIFWTEQRIDDMKNKWRGTNGCPPMSASDIAVSYGLRRDQRGMILGKLDRLDEMGKGGRPNPMVKAVKKKPANYRMKSKPAKEPKGKIPLNKEAAAKQAKCIAEAGAGNVLSRFPIAEPNVLLVDLKPHQCRWPHFRKNDMATHFCGKPTATDSSYCEEHFGLSLGQEARKRRKVQTQAHAA